MESTLACLRLLSWETYRTELVGAALVVLGRSSSALSTEGSFVLV